MDDLSGGDLLLLLGLLLATFFVICLTGGLVAWLVARRPQALVAGTLVFGIVVWVVVGVGLTLPPLAVGIVGWMGSALIGLEIRRTSERAARERR
jgi:uncharacterized membrane protein AbrB (regulator of aidB expression)